MHTLELYFNKTYDVLVGIALFHVVCINLVQFLNSKINETKVYLIYFAQSDYKLNFQ